MSTERDTQFAGFAKLLYAEINKTANDYAFPDKTEEDYLIAVNRLIAQRAYDLVAHILSQTPSGKNYIRHFRDMDAWPEQERFADELAALAEIESNLHKFPPT